LYLTRNNTYKTKTELNCDDIIPKTSTKSSGSGSMFKPCARAWAPHCSRLRPAAFRRRVCTVMHASHFPFPTVHPPTPIYFQFTPLSYWSTAKARTRLKLGTRLHPLQRRQVDTNSKWLDE